MVTEPIRVLVISELQIYALGLVQALVEASDITCVASLPPRDDIIEVIASLTPTPIVVDPQARKTDMVDLIRTIHTRVSSVTILAISDPNRDDQTMHLLGSGATGLLQPDCDPGEVARAIRLVHQGLGYWSPDLTSSLVNKMTETGRRPAVER